MKKTLLLLTVLLLLVSVVLLVSCDNDSNTTEATENTDAVSSVQETTPFSTAPTTTTEAQTTTTMEQTTAATEPPAPVTRDPGKEYYLDVQSIKVNKNNEDADYIIVNTAGANLNERFADNNGYILYWFNLSDLIEGYVVLHIRQNYLVYATQDIEADYEDMDVIGNFNDIADQFPPEGFNENGTYVAGSNKTELVIDPAELGYVGEFYVYIMDCNPADGWGGTINQIDICSYKEGTAPEATSLDDSQGTPNYPSADMVETAVSVAVNGYGEDEEYLFENTASANETRRYADGNSYFIYRIEIRDLVSPKIALKIAQNYLVEISSNGQDWIEVVDFSKTSEYQDLYNQYLGTAEFDSYFASSGDYIGGENMTDIVIDPYEYEIYGALYIKISDCITSAGWGGALELLTISYYE